MKIPLVRVKYEPLRAPPLVSVMPIGFGEALKLYLEFKEKNAMINPFLTHEKVLQLIEKAALKIEKVYEPRDTLKEAYQDICLSILNLNDKMPSDIMVREKWLIVNKDISILKGMGITHCFCCRDGKCLDNGIKKDYLGEGLGYLGTMLHDYEGIVDTHIREAVILLIYDTDKDYPKEELPSEHYGVLRIKGFSLEQL